LTLGENRTYATDRPALPPWNHTVRGRSLGADFELT